MNKRFFYYTVLLSLLTSLLTAQNCPCCTPAHAQFDFWLGQWEVVDSTNAFMGSNQIQKEEGGCLLRESWQGKSGGTGTSLNYFNPNDSLWHQLWISSNGFILKMKGKLEDGSMVLRSALQSNSRGEQFYNQITWTPIEAGRVRQRWDLIKKDGTILRTIFYGIYQPLKN